MDEMILRESKEQNIKEYAMDIYTAGQTLLSTLSTVIFIIKFITSPNNNINIDKTENIV